MTGEERRAEILAAARNEFARHGFNGASTARIAEASQCSEPMLYKHFSSKHELFLAVLDEVSATMEASIDGVLSAPGDPIENWLAYLPVAMRSEAYAEMVGLRKLAVAIVDEPGIRERLASGTERLEARVRMAVQRSQELGSIREDIDADYVSCMWLGITLVASYRNSIGAPGGFGGMLAHATRFLEDLRPYAPGPADHLIEEDPTGTTDIDT